MKRTLFFLASILVLASCSKSNVETLPQGEKVAVSFIAAMPQNGDTKATADGDGAGAYADQCRLQIWWGDVLFYEKVAPVTALTAKFENILLVKDQKYDFLFWADNSEGGYYKTDTLTKVEMLGDYVGGKDQRDAFWASLVDKTISADFTETVYLYRPFAQLNVIATDIPDLHQQFPLESQFSSVLPDSVGLKVTVPTVFNVKTGESSEPKELEYKAPVYADPIKTAAGSRNTLSMDYLLAPKEEGNVVDIKFWANNATSGLSDIKYSFTNVPLRRNYRTNVVGSLITVVGTVTVEIKPAWDGEIDY